MEVSSATQRWNFSRPSLPSRLNYSVSYLFHHSNLHRKCILYLEIGRRNTTEATGAHPKCQLSCNRDEIFQMQLRPDAVLVSLSSAIEDLYEVTCQRTICSLFKDSNKGQENVCNHTLQLQIRYVWYQAWTVTRHSSTKLMANQFLLHLCTIYILNIAGSPETHIHQILVTFSTNCE